MPNEKTILTAAWVAPMGAAAQGLLRDAAILVDGKQIAAVGSAIELRRDHPDAAVRDLGNAVILPGLVNAHVHLELSDATPGPRPAGGFADWLLGMVRRGGTRTSEQVTAAVGVGIAQCFRFGVTSVGDISRMCAISRPVLRQSAINAVSYGEVAGMGMRRGQLEGLLATAIGQDDPVSGDVQIGITPHAPYSIEAGGYRRCLAAAQQRQLPLATHLAESADEATFLARHSGPLRELWTVLNAWDEKVPRFAGGPIRYAKELGLLDYPTLLAHVNYCDDDEMEILAAGRASVVYCPRTHAYFGHPAHRWREMLRRGINVAIGTDSCASSPDLNLVDDLRLMHRIAPDVPAETLWRMATVNAATAIGQATKVGSLEVGKRADVAVFKVNGGEPLVEILKENARPAEVWCAGKRAAADDDPVPSPRTRGEG